MRIAIFGLPGSGKSTFAIQLAQKLNLPLIHLDKYFFKAGWQEVGPEAFSRIHENLIQQDKWIIDGNARQFFGPRFERAQIIIYFKMSRWLCLWRIIKRLFTKRNHIDDRAPECPETFSWSLVHYMWTFSKSLETDLSHLPQTCFYMVTTDDEAQKLLHHLTG